MQKADDPIRYRQDFFRELIQPPAKAT